MDDNSFIYLIARLMHSKSVQHIKNDIKKLGNFYVNLIGKLDLSKTKRDIQMQSKGMNLNIEPSVNTSKVQNTTKQALRNAQKIADKNKVKVGIELERDKLVNQIKILGKENSKLFADSGLTAKYNNLLDSAKLAQSKGELKSLRKQLSAFKVELRATNSDGLNWVTKLKESIKRYTSFFSGASFVYATTGQLRNAWEEAKTLDDVYTDLIKVQDELSRSDYPDYLEDCNKKAKDLATTQQALIESATEFSKSGYSLEESNDLTEKSTILSNVGDMTASDSAKAIISGVQAYDEVDGFTDVVGKADALISKYNEIGNTASITTSEIAEGVQTVGSVFADANTSVDEFIALLAAGNRQFQNADTLALGLRTAALRIRSCSEELEAMGEETEGVYKSTSELEAKIAGLTNIDGKGGVKILEADGETFRSIYDIFLDISEVYQDMSDVDQSALLDLIAGKHRASAISAVLNNMSEAQEIYKKSLDSAGSAQREYDKYLESSEAALNRFGASMTETYQNFITGSTVKDIADMGTYLLELANSFGIVEGSLRGILLLGVGKFLTTTSLAFVQGTKSAERYGQALRMVNSVPQGNQRYEYLKQLASVTKTLTNEQLKQVISSKNLSEQEKIRVLQLSGLSKKAATAKLSELGLTQATKAQTVANNANILSIEGMKSAMVGLGATIKTWFMSNPIGIGLMGISIGISAISSAISSHNQNLEEQKAKTAEMTEAWKSENASINESITSYQELQKKLEDTTLTVDEVKSVKEELATIQDSLTAKYGAEASGIDLVNGKYDEQIAKLRELSSEKAKEFLAENASVVADDRKYLDEKVAVSVKLGDNDCEGLETYLERNGLVKTLLPKDGFYIGGTGTREQLYQQLVDLYSDVARDFGSDTDNPEVKEFQLALSDVINNSFDKDEMEQARNNVRAYAEAELLSNSEGRKLYHRATEAVSSYNEALASGKGVDEAKNSLEAVRKEIDDMTLDIYGAEEVFKDVFAGISESAGGTARTINSSFAEKGFSKSKMISELNDMSEGFEELQKIYESISDTEPFDFKLLDNENFKETFSGLGEVYTNFVEQVASTPSDINACQSAFDSLVTEWIKSLGVLEGVTKENANLTVQMLEQMGVTNAKQIVEQMFTIVNEESEILNQAEAEFLETYQNYLASKDEADLSYLENSASRNGQLVSALGESYQQDYKNWCDLLSKKAEAYNELVQAVGGSYNSAVSTVDNMIANGITPTMSNITNAEALKGQYEAARVEANKLKNSLKLDLSTIKTDFGTSYKPTSVSGVSGGSSGGSSSSKETVETYDWIERKVEAVQRRIESLGKTVEATYKSWNQRNNAISKKITAVNDEISVQQQAYEKYISLANQTGLSEGYKQLVIDGAINIEKVKDEALIEQIKTFEDYYAKAMKAQSAIEDLNKEVSELAKQKFDHVQKEFDNFLSDVEHRTDMLEGVLEQLGVKGYLESKSVYEELIEQEQKNIDVLSDKYNALLSERENAMNTSGAGQDSEYWYELTADINKVEAELQEANTTLIDFQNSLRELEWNKFDILQERIININKETEFMIGLLEEAELHDDKGNITDEGRAVMGLHAQSYNVAMAQADSYAEEAERLNKLIEDDPANQTLLERREELLDLQRESIELAKAEQSAILDLVQQGIDKQIEAMETLADKYKEALREADDLYSFQKNIEDLNEEIGGLEKQLLAYKNDSSEEGRLRVQQTKAKLEEAKEQRDEAEREQYIREVEKLMDSLVDEYSETLNSRMDNVDGLMYEVIGEVNANSGNIGETITSAADEVSYTLSDELQNIWAGGKDIVSAYGDSFNSNATTINDTLNDIKNLVEAMMNEADKEASESIKDIGKNNVPTIQTTPSTSQKTPESNTPSATPTPEKAIKVGGMIDATGANIYDYAGDKSGENQYFKDSKYLVLQEKDGYVQVRHHSLKSGITGWFKKSDVKAYKTGGLVDYTGLAWVDGQKERPEAFLDSEDTRRIGELAQALKGVDLSEYNFPIPTAASCTPKIPTNIFRENMNVNNVFNMSFELNEVQNGREVVDFLIKDKGFEKAVQNMTVGRIAGGNSLNKYKYTK